MKLKLIKGGRRQVEGFLFIGDEFTEVPNTFPFENHREILTDKTTIRKLQEPKIVVKKEKQKLDEDKIDLEETKESIDPELVE